MIKISIIIPIYNVEQYIVSCLESVANQTMTQDVECILIDDCGKDASMAIAQQFVDGYYGNLLFSILHHNKNRGLSAARNTGIVASNGKYLYFVDSDDELTPDAIEKLYNLAEEYQADMVQGCYISGIKMLNEFCNDMPTFSDDQHYIKRRMLDYDHLPVMAQNRLVKKDLVINNHIFFIEDIIHEDKPWTFFLAKKIKRLAICKTPTYTYRTNPGSITSSINVQKEILACKTYLSYFCKNIDPFEIGAQKKWIFLNFLLMWNDGFYESKCEVDNMLKMFLKHNTIPEKFLVHLILRFKTHGFFYNKCVNLLQRIYMLQ